MELCIGKFCGKLLGIFNLSELNESVGKSQVFSLTTRQDLNYKELVQDCKSTFVEYFTLLVICPSPQMEYLMDCNFG